MIRAYLTITKRVKVIDEHTGRIYRAAVIVNESTSKYLNEKYEALIIRANITLCTTVQNCCKGRSKKYRK